MTEGSDPEEPLLVGGRYELGGLLGRGSLSEVYAGRDVRLGRDVAVKVLRPELVGDPSAQDRFRRMAQTTASFNHPAIMSTYDTGEESTDAGARPYIAMERVQGRTLRDILREGRKILPERALEIVAGILAALDYVHQQQMLHRNVTPANVMLTPTGDIKVGGLSLARALAGASGTDGSSYVVGTAQYASPEMLRGESVDSRSDVYGVGCVLYELLTGRPPFVGDSPVAVAYQHVREPAAPPSDLDTGLDPGIDAIVMRALAKQPADRYQSAAAFRADIERYLAGHPLKAPAADPGEQPEEEPGDRVERGRPVPQAEVPPRPPVTRETSHALAPYDVVPEVDGIGREPLLDHLRELMLRLLGEGAQEQAREGEGTAVEGPGPQERPTTFVIGVDAPWGSGKTTLVSLLVASLTQDRRAIGRPVVVRFDAWRQERIGPEWWALGSHLYRGIRSERALASRVGMTTWTALVRLFRSRIFVAAALIVLALATVLGSARLTDVAARWQEVAAVVGVAVTAALGLSRLFFWSSPAIGALYQRSDDAPLTEISEMVARLRRWSPRASQTQGIADNLAGAWLLLTGAGALAGLFVDAALYQPGGWRLRVYLGCCGATAAGLWWVTRRAGRGGRDGRGGTQVKRPGAVLVAVWAGVRARPVRAAAVALGVALVPAFGWLARSSREWRTRLEPVSRDVLADVSRSGAGEMLLASAGLLVVFIAYVGYLSSRPKRPVLLVIDDLDRCTDAKTVAYLETVHTLMRHQDPPRLLRGWRRPAPLFVLVLADGRWIRQSFAKAYDTFETLSADETRGLGADFVQKLFDHTVLVPELSAEQSREYLRVLTSSDAPHDPSTADQESRLREVQESAQVAEVLVRSTSPSELDQLERESEVTPVEAEALRVAVSRRRSSEDYVRELTSHLMTRYADQMPRNPRLIKRVANAWSMLQALQLSIGRVRSEQDLVAAAIVMTAYPTLLDTLLHAPVLPPDTGVWRRPDVVDVRRLGRDACPALRDLAECFGRFFPLTEADVFGAPEDAGLRR